MPENDRRGRPRLDQPKKLISIRLDPDVVDLYRSMGEGWQTRINNDLRKVNGMGER